MNEEITICCNVSCPVRFSCATFGRAVDVNVGKIRAGYRIIECVKSEYYEKA